MEFAFLYSSHSPHRICAKDRLWKGIKVNLRHGDSLWWKKKREKKESFDVPVGINSTVICNVIVVDLYLFLLALFLLLTFILCKWHEKDFFFWCCCCTNEEEDVQSTLQCQCEIFISSCGANPLSLKIHDEFLILLID